MIKAPFNFIPLNDKVYSPSWANKVSHDIPFEEGVSGELIVNIVSKHPIYIRNGHTDQDRKKAYDYVADIFKTMEEDVMSDVGFKKQYDYEYDKLKGNNKKNEKESVLRRKAKEKAFSRFIENNDEYYDYFIKNVNKYAEKYPYLSFSNVDGSYFIPATSVKGCIRNVMEIFSFGKMRLNKEYKLSAGKKIFSKAFYKTGNTDYDLPECIFGSVVGDGENLKGRIHISNAFCTNKDNVKRCDCVLKTMGEPKPTFYPIYVEEESWDPFNLSNIKIRGWKRYPQQIDFCSRDSDFYKSESSLRKQATIFQPIENAEFKCTFRFFNLKKEELGALIASITFLKKENCKHSLGFGKPLGYGTVEMSIGSARINKKEYDGGNLKAIEDEYIQCFISLMESKDAIGQTWRNSPQLVELFAIARGTDQKGVLEYMSLDEHKRAKDNNEFLPPFSAINGGRMTPDIVDEEVSIYVDSRPAQQLTPEDIAGMLSQGAQAVTSENFGENGTVCKAIYVGNKKSILENANELVHCVIPRELHEPLEGETIEVEICQVTKVGKINQVKYIQNK